jgi:6-phosphogluconolactonase
MRRTILAGIGLSALLLTMVIPSTTAAAEGSGGAVYTMSNAPAGNRVLIWERARNGSLRGAGSVATGGTGTGGGLGNQGALVLSGNHRWLYVVNPGSDELSVFRVYGTHLALVEVAPSGGDMPISVTAAGRRIYVLNAGGAGGVAGFRRSEGGIVTPIPGSVRPLSGPAAGPAQIGVSPDRDHVLVTEKMTNRITIYDMGASGALSAPRWRTSAGQTPFGFAFARAETLVVSEAFGGAPDASAASSYRFRSNGRLRLLDGSEPTTETAACWVAVARGGRFAYVTNTGSGTVTGYRVASDGDLTRLDGDGVTADVGDGSEPIDAVVDRWSGHLYVLLAGTDAIAILRIGENGALTARGAVTGLPNGANGLAAF